MIRFLPIGLTAAAGVVDGVLTGQDLRTPARAAAFTKQNSTLYELALLGGGLILDLTRILGSEWTEPLIYSGAFALASKAGRTYSKPAGTVGTGLTYPSVTELPQYQPAYEAAQATQYSGIRGRREPLGIG